MSDATPNTTLNGAGGTAPTPTASPTPATTPDAPVTDSILGSDPAPPPATEEKSAEAAPPPDPFDADKLTLPEGFERNEYFNDFASLAKEEGLTHGASQKLIDLWTKAAKAGAEASTRAWEKQNADWQAEVKADREIGGVKLDGVRQTVARVMDNPALTDPKFREALSFTGAGNHPAIVRTLARWAEALSEGSSVAGNPPGTSPSRPSIAEAIYGPNGPRAGNPRMES